MREEFKPLINSDDVVSVSPSNRFIANTDLYKVGQLTNESKKRLLQKARREIANSLWVTEGVDCELLQLGAKNWRKGKIRIKVELEFCPDESEEIQSESPLDELRQINL